MAAGEALQQVQRYLRLLSEPGDVLEVRAPKCRERPGSSYASTVSGYFTDPDAAAEAIARLDASGRAPGIYVTLNPVRADLLARAANRLRPKAAETTADADIPRRRWLLIDVDPVRPAGVSATDAELALAETRAAAVHEYLTGLGWPAPAVCMSGNGYHLLYRVDLPPDDGGLTRGALGALADRFGDDAVSVDRGVFNPARIVKAIGTVARKGDDLRGQAQVPDRPHRRAVLLDAPEHAQVVPADLIRGLAAQRQRIADAAPDAGRFPADAAGVRAWLEARGVAVKGERRSGSKTLLLLERCPVDPGIVSEGGSDIAVLVGDDGRLAYCNKHNRGASFTWRDLRRAVDPAYVDPDAPGPPVDLSRLVSPPEAPPEISPEISPELPPEVLPGALSGELPGELPGACGDPGPLPAEALRVPGFVGEVMDHCLATAPYPNPTLAFCGALSLQAFLAGRKVRDPADNRTNIYLLGLAHSSAGKDWPRKVNSKTLHAVGLAGRLGEQLASGEGIQDALHATPAMLFQTDEIDALLQSMKRARDARHESIMATLLTMYSASNSVYPMRRRANNPDPGVIDQPCLVLFGTAIPNHYYAALSERMLTNGLFARTIVLESGPRPPGQEPGIPDPPDRVVEAAAWWASFRPAPGNLGEAHPSPRTVAQSGEAKTLLVDLRKQAEAEYARAEARSDAVAATVWGRVSENARKLALIYAVSENHKEPQIGAAAVRWASELVMHQARRMLFMAAGYAAEGEFDELALRLFRKLREAKGRCLPHSVLLKRMKLDAKAFRQLVETLVERGDVAVDIAKTAGRDAVVYRLAVKQGEEGVKEVGAE